MDNSKLMLIVSPTNNSNVKCSTALRPVYTLLFCSCFQGLHFTLKSRPKVYTFCFPFLLSLNWSVTSALQTEIEQVLIGLLAGLQCITPSLHVLLLQLCTKAAAKAERVNWRWKCIPSHNGDEIF